MGRSIGVMALAVLATALTPEEVLAQRRRRGPDRAPKTHSVAPDFELTRLTQDGKPGKTKVKLSTVCKKRPVALVFGSYT